MGSNQRTEKLPTNSAEERNQVNWKQGFWHGCKTFVYVGVPGLVWVLLDYFQVLNHTAAFDGDMILAPLLFVLAIPCSIIIRLDQSMQRWAFDENHNEVALLIALVCVFVNFALLGALGGWRKGLKRK